MPNGLAARPSTRFLPCGPWLVTADEVGDPQALWLRCEVNGERLQDSSTSRMIWPVAELIAHR